MCALLRQRDGRWGCWGVAHLCADRIREKLSALRSVRSAFIFRRDVGGVSTLLSAGHFYARRGVQRVAQVCGEANDASRHGGRRPQAMPPVGGRGARVVEEPNDNLRAAGLLRCFVAIARFNVLEKAQSVVTVSA